MNRRRTKLHSNSVDLSKITPFVLVLLFVLTVIFKNSALVSDAVSSDIYKACLSQSIPGLSIEKTKSRIDINAINTVSFLLPVLKSNDDLTKKYATRYGFIKENSSSGENFVSSNVLELDLSAKGIVFQNPTNYKVDANELLNAPLGIKPPDKTPRVLIVHTHTSEAYSNSEGARSTNDEDNVVKVGEKIAEVLNKNGVVTIHDRTKNDSPSYNGSYKKCLATVEKNLEKYPSIEIVLDIHRDYIERDKNELKPTAFFSEGKAAQIMFVVGTDSMGLYHPNWRENLSLAVKMQNNLIKTRPGLCRSINIRTERFNHHTTKGSMIIEVGSSANTITEAVRSGEYIGKALSEILKNL